MLPIALLSLLGIGLGAFAIDEIWGSENDSTSSEGDPDNEDTDRPPPNETDEIQITTPDTPGGTVYIQGTDADERFDNRLFDDLDLEDRQMDLRAGRGEDNVHVMDRDGTFSGGAGEDRMSAYGGIGQTLDGGHGDDTVTGNQLGGARLFGGEGDDRVTLDQAIDAEYSSFADGGNGDDTLFSNITPLDGASQSFGILRGGDGDDTFTLRLTPNDAAYNIAVANGTLDEVNADGDPVVDSGVMAQIDDFNPDNDTLSIDVNWSLESENSLHDFRDFELSERDGGTDVNLIFDALRPDTDGTYELVSTVRLEGVTGLSKDDITVDAPAPGMIGTPDDDVIEVPRFNAPARVLAGDGDDLVSYPGNDSITIEGGAGDDTLTAPGDDITLLGQAGNDVLSGGHASQMFGGDGNDRLSLDITDGFHDTAANLDGGAGDDTLSALADLGDGSSAHSYGVLTGGEGSDTFNVTLNLVSDTFSNTPSDDLLEQRINLILRDFNPSEDVLNIQIDRAEGGEGRDMTSAEIIRDDTGNVTLMMNFAAAGVHPAVQTTMNLGTNPDITLDDITFIPPIAGTGTPGDDVIEVMGPSAPESVMAGDGNDRVQTSLNRIDIFGGNGNDTLIADRDGSDIDSTELYGDDGDDVLIGAEMIGGRLDGGAGDDDITFKTSSYDEDRTALIGGDGNDTLNVDLGLAVEAQAPGSSAGVTVGNYIAPLVAEGGSGADTYNLALTFPETRITRCLKFRISIPMKTRSFWTCRALARICGYRASKHDWPRTPGRRKSS